MRKELWPGVGLACAVAAGAWVVSLVSPVVSALVVAIIAGVVWTNTLGVASMFEPGIAFSAKFLLRAGIVLLGLRLSLSDIFALGWPALVLVVIAVAGGLGITVFLGRAWGLSKNLSLLIASGFSICGAAAVAGAAGVRDPEGENETDTLTAVALVVIFGTIMIPLIPLLAAIIGLTPEQAGMWAGAAVHEIAQVVAIGGILGGGALAIAVIVKLARVLMLAPMMVFLAIDRRREQSASHTQAKLPPIVPPFIIAFLGVVILRTFVELPAVLLESGLIAQTILLSAAMFGLGCGVKISTLKGVGIRPFIVAGLSTLVMLGIGGGGALILG